MTTKKQADLIRYLNAHIETDQSCLAYSILYAPSEYRREVRKGEYEYYADRRREFNLTNIQVLSVTVDGRRIKNHNDDLINSALNDFLQEHGEEEIEVICVLSLEGYQPVTVKVQGIREDNLNEDDEHDFGHTYFVGDTECWLTTPSELIRGLHRR
jgi:hypothetical protein